MRARRNFYDGIDFYLENKNKEKEKAIVCALSYMTFLVKKLWPDAIISHASRVSYFRPLVKTVEEINRNMILAMFEEGRFMGCYNEYLANNRRFKIPLPNSFTYQRPYHETDILPSN